MRIRALVPIAVAAALVSGACARDQVGSDAATPVDGVSSATGESPAASPTQSPTEIPTAEASPTIEDGRNFAFIKAVDTSSDPVTVTFDLAYFLQGDAAAQAAKDHGDEYPPPNDYYIVNDNPKLRTVPLAPEAPLVLLDWNHCCDQTFDGDLTDFAKAFAEGELTVDGHLYKGNVSQYWLIVKSGVIVKIEEQYLP
jgi:hypothetical protein